MKTDDYTDRIVQRLGAEGYGAATIARLVGLTETDVLRILQGLRQKNEEEQRPPPTTVVRPLAEFYGVKPRELIDLIYRAMEEQLRLEKAVVMKELRI